MTKNEKRFLARRVCWLCEQPLDRDSCGAIWEPCSPLVRANRRQDCLKTYKPRPVRREAAE